MRAAHYLLLVGGSSRINLNKWLLIMGKVQIQFSEERGRRCWRQRKRECKTRGGEREKERGAGEKDEAGREME